MSESDSWRQIVNRAWEDSEFKARLLKHTKEVLIEYDIKVTEGVSFKVVEDHTQGVRHLVLPPKPDPNNPDLSIDDFERFADSGDPGF